MAMSFEDIMTTYYAEYFQQGLFSLSNNGDGAFISFWNVPDIAQPTYEEVMALDTPELEHQFNVNNFFNAFSPVIQQYIDLIAMLRGYNNSIYCLSYFNSSVDLWKNDAIAFNEWRDSVWIYIESQKILIQNGQRPIPVNIDELKDELPKIVWPN